MREIHINGHRCPLHFGLRSLNDFAKRTGGNFGTLLTTTEAISSLEALVAITALGLNEGAKRECINASYTEEEVWDFFDEEPRLVLEVADIFKESIDALTAKLGDIDPK